MPLPSVKTLSMESPTRCYNFAAESHVRVSFDLPEYTANDDGIGTLRILDAIRAAGLE